MKSVLFVLFLISVLASCTSKVYVSHTTLNQWKAQGIDPKKLQYYNDYTFWWDTKAVEANSEIKNGGLIESRQKVEYKKTYIKAETPCTITDIGGLYVDVVFEEGGQPIKFWYSDKKPDFTLLKDVQYGREAFKRESTTPIRIFAKSKDLKKVVYKKNKLKGVRVE